MSKVMVIGQGQEIDTEHTIDGHQGVTILAFFMMSYHKQRSVIFRS